MNARTSRLLRRMAFVVHQVEARAAQASKSTQRVPTEAMQLRSLKDAWNKTQRPQRCATRVRLVGIFNTLVGASQ